MAAQLSRRSTHRRVSFSDRVQNDFIDAQLSSISAPVRAHSESGDSEEEADEGDEAAECASLATEGESADDVSADDQKD